MHTALAQMLKRYQCSSQNDYSNALKEIIQELALLGLWRAKFYENAAFYGGSALRILYDLDRFSEDLDFTLLSPDENFSLAPYIKAIQDELNSFGLETEVNSKVKNSASKINSAFIKANTKQQLILINTPQTIIARTHNMQTLKIKMEVDTNPPGSFNTEVKTLLQPIPFSIKTLIMPDLFAGKVHALLCRPWQKRVKGRDWYDFVWYISRNTPLNLIHLRERLIQSDAWSRNKKLQAHDVINLLSMKITNTNFDNAKDDIQPFIKDAQSIQLWSSHFFMDLLKRLKFSEKL